MKEVILRHHRLISSMLVVLVVGIAETVLIEAKYNYFTGGFLQSHTLAHISDRLGFILIATWVDIYFYGMIAMMWTWLWQRTRCNPYLMTYHYIYLVLSVSLFLVIAKYQLFSYFSDAVNFHVIKNLGGGSLSQAILYIADEARLSIIIMLSGLVIYVFGHVKFKKRVLNIKSLLPDENLRGTSVSKSLFAVFITSIFTLAFIQYTFSNDDYRFGVGKKLSYGILTSMLGKVTDFDGDGYGYFKYPSDNDPFDSSIYPSALDIPNNSIDENGYGGDFVLPEDNSKHEFRVSKIAPSKQYRHLILIMLESARGDMLSKKINKRYVMPNTRQISSHGTTFDAAYSHTGYTSSSLKAVFAGRLLGTKTSPSLFEILHNSGYFISVFSGQDESFGDISSITGMKKYAGYFFDAQVGKKDRVFSSSSPGSLRLDEARLLKEIEQRFSITDWQQPQFMYINFQAAHFPYHHPGMPQILGGDPIPRNKITADNREWVEKTYWNALAYADDAIGKLVKKLKQAGVYENSVIVITGDHGESLFDDGFLGHGHALNDIQTRIPLIFSTPGFIAQEPIGQTDLFYYLLKSISVDADEKTWKNQPVNKGVFQFVGNLKTPELIGMVNKDKHRTILNLKRNEVYFSDTGKWLGYEAVMQHKEYRSRLLEVIHAWEYLRWQSKKAS